jgi:thiosulfate/3-mercaptopyruvate sulfurtransferase
MRQHANAPIRFPLNPNLNRIGLWFQFFSLDFRFYLKKCTLEGNNLMDSQKQFHMPNYTHPEVLVSTQWVDENRRNSKIVIAEVDVDTKSYEEGHIPGAVAWNWQTDLCDTVERDIIKKDKLENLLGRSGISNDTTVVLYGDNNNWFAAWAFWQMKIYNHKDVRIMNGGRKKWLMEGREMTQTEPRKKRVEYRAEDPDFSHRVFLPQVMSTYNAPNVALVDVRSADEFTGRILSPPGLPETCQRGGHIPGARNIGWAAACNDDGTFKNAEDLKKLYENQGVTPDKDVITYCRIGERSSHTWFVLKYLLGYPEVRNYDGSWTEWGNLVGAPVETGGAQSGKKTRSYPVGAGKAEAQDYHTEKREFRGVRIIISSYKIGDRFFCHVTNEDPGATVARADGPDRNTAVSRALDNAFDRL